MAEESPTKIIVSGTNGEVIHEDPASKINTDVKTEGEVNSNEANGSPSETPVDSEPVPKPKLTPDEYLEKHKVNILFEELIYRTLDSTPENPLKFLLSNLETMEKDNWVPVESQEEKANAVTKIFKLPEPEPKKPDPPKVGTTGARTGAGRGTTPKVGPGTTRPAARSATTRPAPASKIVSSPAKTTTPSRVTTTKPVVKTTATPVKPATTVTTRTTGTSTARATTAPAKTTTSPGTATKTTTTGAAKTGTASTTRPTPPNPVGAFPPKKTTTFSSSATKTGSNTSVNKTAGAAKTTATPRSTARQPANTGRNPTVTKTPAGAGSRVSTTKQPLGRGVKTTATPGRNPGGVGAKQEVVAPPAPEPPTPVEEPKPESPEPAEPEAEPQPEPKPKTPEPDGQWSKIPCSDGPEDKPLDLEEQLVLDDVAHQSDDESIETVEKPISEDQPTPGEELIQVIDLVEKPTEPFMTSLDYSAGLQNIENEAEQANQGDKLEDMIDEGIEMREDFVRTSIPTMPPGMSQILGAYKSVKTEAATPSDAQDTVEVVVDDSEQLKQTEELIDTQTPPESHDTVGVIVENPIEELIQTQEEPLAECQGDVNIIVEENVTVVETQVVDPMPDLLSDDTELVHQTKPDVLVETAQEQPQLILEAPLEEMIILPEINVPLVEVEAQIVTDINDALAHEPDLVDDGLAYKPDLVYDDTDLVHHTNPVIDPMEPPTPEVNPPEPLTQTQPEVPIVPSPDPQEEVVPIDPIFPPASTGDVN